MDRILDIQNILLAMLREEWLPIDEILQSIADWYGYTKFEIELSIQALVNDHVVVIEGEDKTLVLVEVEADTVEVEAEVVRPAA